MSDLRDGCPEFDERLLDSVFAPAPDAPLERHLASCGRCRHARDLYLRAADGIAGALAMGDAVAAPAPAERPSRGGGGDVLAPTPRVRRDRGGT
jgi:hypothetical protein